MRCAECGSENEAGRKFCGECGRPLALACPACGAPNSPTVKFCGECGSPLTGAAAPAAAPAAATPVAERRLVTVLFLDLVGFTSASENRDAEDTRELLSRYFDTSRRLIERYGGTVEKFIGDAVMAVWGTPAANEDDAERTVRAALDLVAVVPQLDPALAARAGVLTGEAAVTLGAAGEGMVAGELVNTASRVQSAAAPGTVLVGEATKRASEAAIAYEDAGAHELKGKVAPVQLWRALRVTAVRAGTRKSVGLEAPFVGRDRELRLVKELFHGSAEERKAHLASVVGIAGIGKSRLAWEFEKYLDGLVDNAWWHRGRCLAYGEGVTYWALAEMVRMRAQIAEGEGPEPARAKLRAALERHVADADERAWIEPRLAQLLGLEEGAQHERDVVFAAWRLLFERLADTSPCVLVFEDMQWADRSLLEFVDYLLDWSRSHPIFVLALSRPELAQRHGTWGNARNATTLSLEPLPPAAMDALLEGLVPGLPRELAERILSRAEGVPLYAVETVRMLLDRGLLERDGDGYRATAEIEALDVPETLHALVAARLDGLEPTERRLLQDAAVLGKTFTKPALAALSGTGEDELDRALADLVRKEVFSLQADPRSPERGQYGFLQDLLRQVAYETLARAERKARHLAAAEHLQRSWPQAEQDVVEVVASHYVAALEADPGAADAAEIGARARELLARAGERAASLAARDEAQRYYAQAAELAADPLEEAALRESAGQMADPTDAVTFFSDAAELYERAGETHAAARASARLGGALWTTMRIEEGISRMEQALAVLAGEPPDGDIALLHAQLGRLHFFGGDFDRAEERIGLALEAAESLRLPEVLSGALTTKSLILKVRGHPEEGLALVRHALAVALEHDLVSAALRAYVNLSVALFNLMRWDECETVLEEALELARTRGYRQPWLIANLADLLQLTGEWERALALGAEVPPDWAVGSVTRIETSRGRVEAARSRLEPLAGQEASSDVQTRANYLRAHAIALRAEGRLREAHDAAATAAELLPDTVDACEALVEAAEAALALGDLEEAARLADVGGLAPRDVSPLLLAQVARLGATLDARRGERERADAGFRRAAALFRELGTPFWLAVTLLEHAELSADGAEPLVAEAREIFERLDARPWVERCDALAPRAAVA